MKKITIYCLLMNMILTLSAVKFTASTHKINTNQRVENEETLSYAEESIVGYVEINNQSKFAIKYELIDFFSRNDSIFTIDNLQYYKDQYDPISHCSFYIYASVADIENENPIVQAEEMQLSDGWNNIPMPCSIINEFWVVFQPFAGEAVPVSNGSGQHSFVLNSNSYLQSFTNLSMPFELVLNVDGTLPSETYHNVRLTNFSYEASARDHFYISTFTIENKSDDIIENLQLEITSQYKYEEAPNSFVDSVQTKTFLVPSLNPNSIFTQDELTFLEEEEIGILLPDSLYTQCKFTAQLISEDTNYELPEQTFYSGYINNFIYPNNKKVVRNVLDENRTNATALLETQQMYWGEDFVQMQFFSNPSDSLYRPFALEFESDNNIPYRPTTVLESGDLIPYYAYPESGESNYDEDLSRYIEDEKKNHCFAFNWENQGTVVNGSNYIVSFCIRNDTGLLQDDYLNQLEVNAYLVATVSNAMQTEFWQSFGGYYVLDEIELTEMEGNEGGSYQKDDAVFKQSSFYFFETEIPDYSADFDVAYLVIFRDDQNIIFVEETPFENFEVGNDDAVNSSIKIKSAPNPFQKNQNIWIETKERIEQSEIEIYNIRGQKVKHLTGKNKRSFSWNGTNESNKKVASGVYFMSIKVKTKNEMKTEMKRCLFIK